MSARARTSRLLGRLVAVATVAGGLVSLAGAAGAAGADPAPPPPVFETKTSGIAQLYPGVVTAADLDADGIVDVASTAASTARVYIHTGTGDGTFESSSRQVGSAAYDVTAGDVDGDGDLDLVTADFDNDSVTIVQNSATGFESSGETLPLLGRYPQAVAIGDFVEGGLPEIVVTTGGGVSAGVEMLTDNGSGYDDEYVVTTGRPYDLAIADLDGDGHLDLATTDPGDGTDGYFVSIHLGHGDGTFTTSSVPVAAYPAEVATGDVDGDSDIEVLASVGSELVVVDRDQVAGTWSGTDLDLASAASTDGVTAADLDGDGTEEIVVTEGAGAANPANRHIEIFRHDGAASWPRWGLIDPGAALNPLAVAPADFDGDADIDLVVADGAYDGGADALTTYLNGGTSAGADTTAPVSTDDVPSTAVHAPVTVTLSATDAGGSGVKEIRYTKGTTPSEPTVSSTLYDPASKPTLVNGEKIRYFAVDNAGNAEAPHTSAAAQVTATVSTPAIGGSPVVGQTLSASATVQPAGATPSYQWQRIDSGGARVPISGATGAMYQVQTADIGQRLGVQVAVAPSGYAPASSESVPTAAVTAAPTTTPSPPITGLTVRAVGGVRVGETRVAETSVDGDPTVTLSYQWQAAGLNGSWVNLTGPGTTSRSYELPPGVMKINVRVVVLATRGTAQALAISAPLVILPGNHDAKKLRIKGKLVVGGKLRAVFKDQVVPEGAKVTYAWVIGGNEYRLTGKRITVPKGAAGKKVIVDIRITAPGYHNQQLRSPAERIA